MQCIINDAKNVLTIIPGQNAYVQIGSGTALKHGRAKPDGPSSMAGQPHRAAFHCLGVRRSCRFLSRITKLPRRTAYQTANRDKTIRRHAVLTFVFDLRRCPAGSVPGMPSPDPCDVCLADPDAGSQTAPTRPRPGAQADLPPGLGSRNARRFTAPRHANDAHRLCPVGALLWPDADPRTFVSAAAIAKGVFS